jgi:prepilin-type N-terminal cleavage/methylation domain-containing protein
MMKYLRNNNKGFTLVEVIVVAVIVLVLAAVAIPMYMNYVRDSRRAAAENAAGSIATFMGTALQLNTTISTNASDRTWTTPDVNVAGNFTGGTSVVCPRNLSCAVAGGVVTVTNCPAVAETTAEVNFGTQNPLGTITAIACP